MIIFFLSIECQKKIFYCLGKKPGHVKRAWKVVDSREKSSVVNVSVPVFLYVKVYVNINITFWNNSVTLRGNITEHWTNLKFFHMIKKNPVYSLHSWFYTFFYRRVMAFKARVTNDKFLISVLNMVLILDSNSEIGAHVLSYIGYLICIGHVFISKAAFIMSIMS